MASREAGRRPLPVVRTGQGSTKLSKDEFTRRLRERSYDPEFEHLAREIDEIVDVAWESYSAYRRSSHAESWPRLRRPRI